MAYRDRENSEKSGAYDYCMMEVRLKKKTASPDTKSECRVLMVDSHWETLRFVQDNMEECVGNMVRMKRLEAKGAKGTRGVDESAALFEKNLEPLIEALTSAKGHGVMDKLSTSLKKALLLMVMDRFKSDREQACRVLGITREKLETELKLCGVPQR